MKNNRHSYPSFSAKGSKVAAASSVASAAAHGQGNTMKLKKSDLVSGGHGEDVNLTTLENDHIQPDHPGSQGGEFSADFGKGKHMLRGEEKHRTSVTAYFYGDATTHKTYGIEPANTMDLPRLDRDIEQSHAVDNCLDVSPRMNQLVPSATSHGMSISGETPWTRYKMLNTDHKQELVPEEIQNLLDLDHEAIMQKCNS